MLGERLHAFGAQRGIDAALHDAEQAVARPLGEGALAAFGPFHRQPHRGGGRRLLDRPARAFVERHGDVGVQELLDLDRALRRQPMLRAVDRRAEGDAVGVELAQFLERHHLEAARIGQDRARPVHELVQPAQRRHALGARPQHQVEGVAEHDLRAGLGDRLRQHRLDRAGGAERHEGRRLDRAVRGGDAAATGGAVAGQKLEGKTHRRNKQQSP